jgi:hypothetical protein
MLELRWIVAGVITGLLLSTIVIPPNRVTKSVPSPHDTSVYRTDTGCVRFSSVEVPCGAEADSLNLLATTNGPLGRSS